MKFYAVAAAFATTLLASSADAACQKVQTVEGLDLDEFTRASWYVQAQQVVQFQPAENLFCLTATYNQDSPSVPFFSGPTISVHNYGNEGGVNGPAVGGPLCARAPEGNKASELLVAPCFLPNFAAGNYWVVGLGLRDDSSYEWALVSGGQPDVQYKDGCTTREDRATNAGLFLLSRDQVLSEVSLANVAEIAGNQGITLERMISVPQAGCNYEDVEEASGAPLKRDVFAPLSLGNTTQINTIAFAQLESAAACIKLYKLENNECGEVCLSSTIAPFAIQFGGVTEGTCANQDYTVYSRTEQVSVGPFGTFDTDLYTK
jgi:lipocalin